MNTTPPEIKPKRKWKPLLTLALVFLAGILVGMVGTRLVIRRLIHRVAQDPDLIRRMVEKEMDRKLGLDATQREQTHKILLDGQEKLRALRFEFQPRAMDVATNFQAQMDGILTPEQRKKFDEMKKNSILARWNVEFANPPGH